MFAHPKCPCTHASMEELNLLLARSGQRVATHVYFFTPANSSARWAQTDLWRSASGLPGVTVHEDADGAMARRFGAETSGFVVLYDVHGRLQFKGGITSARGHVGENAGEKTLTALLGGQPANLKQTPVYGCSLLGESCCQKETQE